MFEAFYFAPPSRRGKAVTAIDSAAFWLQTSLKANY